MKGVPWGLIMWVAMGVVIGILLAAAALLCVRLRKRRASIRNGSSRRPSIVPLRTNGVDYCSAFSDSTSGQESPRFFEENIISSLAVGPKRQCVISVAGLSKYSYKDLKKATSNFTTLIGQGALGSVFKAQISTGETVAVKVLATDSKQGEREFQNEVLLLGRLHHRNLVNLVGYCTEKGQHILIYVYMHNGSLSSRLYNEHTVALCWDLRINIALDVARGLEYLHDGAIPAVIHRDIKSSNILLDSSMNARVADFGLSREEMVSQTAPILGTCGYLNPEYVSSRSFTKKSDVYSFGILLFELITGRPPQQYLLEYVELAALDGGGVGWEEIADSRLEGAYEVEELNEVANLAYRCIDRLSAKRPSMREALSIIVRQRNRRTLLKRRMLSLTIEEEVSAEQEESINDLYATSDF